jgi:hypothetical protein
VLFSAWGVVMHNVWIRGLGRPDYAAYEGALRLAGSIGYEQLRERLAAMGYSVTVEEITRDERLARVLFLNVEYCDRLVSPRGSAFDRMIIHAIQNSGSMDEIIAAVHRNPSCPCMGDREIWAFIDSQPHLKARKLARWAELDAPRTDGGTKSEARAPPAGKAERPVVIIIRDGWGYRTEKEGNAVLAARTPNMDLYKKTYPWTLLTSSGKAVGVRDGFQGSSEVGHLNIGAGRIVWQELTRIDNALADESLFRRPMWTKLMDDWKDRYSRLHLLALLQDEGVHAHQDHLFAIMRRARKEKPYGQIFIHPFLDGRDTPPRSTLKYLSQLEEVVEEIGPFCSIGTVMGRYFAMDRGKVWRLTDQAYDCLVSTQGRWAESVREAVEESYAKDTTPDDKPMVDE